MDVIKIGLKIVVIVVMLKGKRKSQDCLQGLVLEGSLLQRLVE